MSRSQNRAYKKGKPYRDFRKFIIVAEGEREDDYFTYFKQLSLRIDVEIVEREGGKSAAEYLWERLEKYDYQFGIAKEDFVWFVLDVDHWPKKEIQNLYDNCQGKENMFVGISNPSFEVWLHYHILKAIPDNLSTAKQFKSNLPKIVKGGYNRNLFAELIETAIENADQADRNKEDYFPETRMTKVYELAAKLIQFLGKNWKKTV